MKKLTIILGLVLLMSILMSIVFAATVYADDTQNFGSWVSQQATYDPGYLSSIVHDAQDEAAAAGMNLGQGIKEFKLGWGLIPGHNK